MKKILAIVISLSMVFTVPVFADTDAPTAATVEATTTAEPTPATAEASTTTTTTNTTEEPGITPDSILYSLDKLMEKIQLSLITDAVEEAEALAKIAQERLAESNAMVDKEAIELSKKALEEYKANLKVAVELIEQAMEDGKQVASVMDKINDANLKDAAAIEKILASIPEEFRVEVKASIQALAEATEAAAETAEVVEGTKEEQNSVKQEITNKIIEEKIQDAALIAKINEAGLNTRQVIAIISLAEQADKPLIEVIDLFLENEKGIGSTAKELGLTTKDALKGINGSFRETKATIKTAFKEAIKLVDEDEQEEAKVIVDSTLAGQTEETKEASAKIEKIVKDAKAQIEIIAGNKDKKAIKKIEKEIEKLENAAEKAVEKIEKSVDKDKDDNDDVKENAAKEKGNSEKNKDKESKGKSDKKN